MKKAISFIVSLLLVLQMFTCINLSAIENISNSKISNNLSAYIKDHKDENVEIEVGIFIKDLTPTEISHDFQEQSVNLISDLRKNSLTCSFKNSNNDINAAVKMSRETFSELYLEHNQDFIDEFQISDDCVSYISHYSPLVIAKLHIDDIGRISKLNNVSFIDLYYRQTISNTTDSYSADDSLAMQICRINEVVSTYGLTGSGVNVGIVDMGIPSESELTLAGIDYTSSNLYGSYNGTHPIHCGKIIHNVAPDAELFFAGGANYGVVECIEWVLDQEAMVINISLSVGGTINQYTSYSKWMDHISYQHFAMIVTSSGNIDDDQESIGCYDLQMSYNAITVGQLDCKNTAAYSDDTIGIAQYNPTSNAPFKPDLSGSYGDTSSSTALITGGIALLLDRYPSMRMYSETVKALLAASVNRQSPHRYVTANRTTNQASYMQVGSGLFDAYRFITNAINGAYYNEVINNGTVQDVITLAADKNVRLALAYVQPITVSTLNHSYNETAATGDIVNYHIEVYKQGVTAPVATSYTNNNLEVVDFNTGSGGNFTIRIIAVSGSNDDVFYSVAYDLY